MELIAAGFAGLSGSRIILEDETRRRQLKERYAASFFARLAAKDDSVLRQEERLFEFLYSTAGAGASTFASGNAAENDGDSRSGHSRRLYQQETMAAQTASDQKEACTAKKRASALPFYDIECAGEGGVYAALWRLLKRNRSGAAYSQRAIPIRQDVIELCEFFSLNPYRLYAAGCALILTDAPGRWLAAAEKAGIPAARFGYTEKTAAIRRTDCPETAFLRRPEPDALTALGIAPPASPACSAEQ